MGYKMYDFLVHSLRDHLILFEFYIFPYKIQWFPGVKAWPPWTPAQEILSGKAEKAEKAEQKNLWIRCFLQLFSDFWTFLFEISLSKKQKKPNKMHEIIVFYSYLVIWAQKQQVCEPKITK